MARNRVIYQSEALFVGPDATSGHYAIPNTVAVKKVGGTSAAGTIDLNDLKVEATTALAAAGTNVTLSGIYTVDKDDAAINPFSNANRPYYSTIKANFGAIASSSTDGMVPHNGGTTRIVNSTFAASGSKLIAQTDGATGIAIHLNEPLTAIPITGYSGATSDASGSGFTGFIPVTNRVKQLMRVQSANYGFDIGRTDVNQFGNLAAIDRIILEQPTVNLDFSYLLTSGENEKKLGFGIGGEESAVGNFLSGIGDSRNYWVYIADEGNDANDANTAIHGRAKSIGIGNAFLTSYTAEGSVGDFPTASLNAEALNMRFFAKNSGSSPAVEPVNGTNFTGSFQLPTPTKWNTGSVKAEITALRPGDVSMNISGTKGLTVSDLKLQNFSFNFDMAREPLNKLGSKFAFSREISFPVTATCSADAILGEVEAGNLADVVNDDSSEYTVRVTINQPGTSNRAIQYDLKGCKLESQSFSSSIGDNKSVSMEWATQVGGPQDTAHGIKITSATSVA
tara:strand:- start:15 stop:1541 length:1527 start_codon:yes stop_codon:yes gene_type:complete